MPDFSQRSTQAEYMDNPNAPVGELRENLRELEVINKLLGGYDVVLQALKKYVQPGTATTIMDIGCGGGDTLRAISKWASKEGIQANLIGVDINPIMTAYAREHTPDENIEFHTADVFDDRLLQYRPDITTCSLFCHHFNHAQLVALLKRMHELAGTAVIINDLHRHWFAYYSIKLITALFSRSVYVKHDGPLSVARALTRREWAQVLQECGFTKYTLRWRWAWRWQLVIEK